MQGVFNKTAPMATLVATATFGGGNFFATDLPVPISQTSGEISRPVEFALDASMPMSVLVAEFGRDWALDLTAPMSTLSAAAGSGRLYTLAKTAPMATLAAELRDIRVIVTSPLSRVEGTIAPNLLFTFSGTAPLSGIQGVMAAVASEVYTGIALNTKTLSVAKVAGYGFTKLVRMGNGDIYGCNSGGIFKLGGTADDGADIAASFTSGEALYDSVYQKRVPIGYVVVRLAEGDELALTLYNDTDAETYTIEGLGSGTHTVPVTLCRGVSGTAWRTKLANVGGAYFEVVRIDLHVDTTLRRS